MVRYGVSTAQCLAAIERTVLPAENSINRVDSISNKITDDVARTVGSKIKMGVVLFNETTIIHDDYGNANVATDKPSRVVMCSTKDLTGQNNEPGRLYNAFTATEVISTTVLIQTEGTWPFGSLKSICSAPRSWSFIEQSRSIISLGKQDRSDVTHIQWKTNRDVQPFYDTALMALKSHGVEGGSMMMVNSTLRSFR